MDGACKQFEESLVLYHYGELGPEEAARVAAHVGSCGSCRMELADMARSLGLFAADAPNPYEVVRAARGVKRALLRRAASRRRLIPVYIASAAAALAIILSVSVPRIFETAPQTPPMVVAQGDWDMLENYDVVGDIDVIETMASVEGLDDILQET